MVGVDSQRVCAGTFFTAMPFGKKKNAKKQRAGVASAQSRQMAQSRGGAASVGQTELEAAAATFGRSLFHVAGDNRCQFHALLHALTSQLHPPRAAHHDVDSLRAALVNGVCRAAPEHPVQVP